MLFKQGDFIQQDGQQASPESIKRRRDLAGLIRARTAAPQNIGEGLNAVGSALKSRRLNKSAEADEQAGRTTANEAFGGAVEGGNLNTLLQASANPFLTDGQQRVLGVLQNQKLQENDPLRQLQIQRAQQGLSLDRQRFGLQQQQFNFRRQQAQAAANRPAAARTAKDANGRLRFLDGPNAGSFVFSDVETKPKFNQLSPEDIKARGLDPSKAFQTGPDGRVSQIGDSGTNVKVNVGGGETAFAKEAGKVQAKSFSDLADQGVEARDNLAVFNQLEGALNNIGGGGVLTSLKGSAASLGLPVEGKTDFDVATTLIDRLTPRQRPPGSGATSDFEARLFKNSLPSLRKTPEGNQIILQTYKNLAQNAQQRGEISNLALTGQITRQQAVEQFKALPDPQAELKQFQKGGKTTQTPRNAPQPNDAAVNALIQNPNQAAQFDEIFGQGAAQKVLGGR